VAKVTSERQRERDVLEPRLVLLTGSAPDTKNSELTRKIDIAFAFMPAYLTLVHAVTGSRSDRDILTAVLSQFKRVTDDLNTLIQQVGCFVDWWGDVNASLANLERILPQIRVDGSNPFRTDTVKERWEGVHQKYILYQRQVRRHIRVYAI
jgi:hypothetical protein